MKVLLLSNQGMVEPFVGNPIMLRMRDAMLTDSRIDEVKMLRCKEPFSVRKQLREYAKCVDVIHLHFGGLYALIVWILLIGIKRPKYITFHGTDIHAKAVKTAKSRSEKIRIKLNQYASFFCISLYDRCGFVASEMMDYVPSIFRGCLDKKSFIHPLGVSYSLFAPMDKNKAQAALGLSHKHYALFSDVHNTTIKRRDIANAIVDLLPDYELLIMCGVQPNQVPLYINACDFVLLTSDEEGSPNIIREALSLNKSVFSVQVGDAEKQLQGLQNSCIISRNPSEAALMIQENMAKNYIDNSREIRRYSLDMSETNRQIINMYVN